MSPASADAFIPSAALRAPAPNAVPSQAPTQRQLARPATIASKASRKWPQPLRAARRCWLLRWGWVPGSRLLELIDARVGWGTVTALPAGADVLVRGVDG